MEINYPEWLIAIPALLLLGVQYPSLKLYSPLRALLALIAVLALIGIEIGFGGDNLNLWLLVDKSASAQHLIGSRQREWENLLNESKPHFDSINTIDFADVAVVRGEGDALYFEQPREESKIALATKLAISRMKDRQSNRILLLSDGYSTEPLNWAGDLLALSGVSLDYKLSSAVPRRDVRIDRIVVPTRVRKGEGFMIEIGLAGGADKLVPVEIYRNGIIIAKETAEIVSGRAVLRLSDTLNTAQAANYSARIFPKADPISGNNTANTWVEVQGPKKVLIVSGYQDEPLAGVLADQGIEAVVVRDPSALGIGHLSGASAVVFNNVPASKVPEEFIKALPFYVKVQGGGLLMIGGKNSFGAGGYFQSAVDELLPVSMELREEERRASTAMAIVLDRSGSMGASVDGHMGNMQKMDLANEGAARTISLLSSSDKVAVLAVDSEAHEVFPLSEIGSKRDQLMSKARSVNSEGGGIYVYNGLLAAWNELKKEKTLQKHIILFADAADAEEPGDYKKLLEEMKKAETTVTAIGLGTASDVDAKLLEEIGTLGGGRVFFVSNAVDLPAVFAQETVSVARSTFIKEPKGVKSTNGWKEVSPFSLGWMNQVDGYNLNYLKPKASAALISRDEYNSPLVATWQKGVGRAAAISFTSAGDYSASVRSWNRYGDFFKTMLHWLRSSDLPAGLAVRTKIDGTVLIADLFYSSDWEDKVSESSPELILASSEVSKATKEKEYLSEAGAPVGEDKFFKVVWRRLKPGHFQASFELSPGEVIRGAIKIAGDALPFGPVTLGKSPEWDLHEDKRVELVELALKSGGEERLDLASIWNAPRPKRSLQLTKPLLYIFLPLFLLEALLARMNKQFQWPNFFLPRQISGLSKYLTALANPFPRFFSKRQKSAAPVRDQREFAEDDALRPQTADEKRRELFERAKRGGVQ